jgi:hypothetical protein
MPRQRLDAGRGFCGAGRRHDSDALRERYWSMTQRMAAWWGLQSDSFTHFRPQPLVAVAHRQLSHARARPFFDSALHHAETRPRRLTALHPRTTQPHHRRACPSHHPLHPTQHAGSTAREADTAAAGRRQCAQRVHLGPCGE